MTKYRSGETLTLFLERVDYDKDELNEWKLAKFLFVTDSSTTTTLAKDIMIKT